MISKRDVQLGKIALRAGMVTKEQINKCLALKKKLAKAKGKKVALGALLLKKGYLDKDQLEEIVKLHNAEKEKKASSPDAGTSARRKSSRKTSRSKRSRAETAGDAEEGAAEEGAEPKRRSRRSKRVETRRSARRKRESTEEAQEAPAEEAASPERVRKKKKKKKKKSSTTSTARKKSSSGTRRAKRPTDSEVDPAVFQSAPAGAVDEEDRRIIACAECGKKYRIRPKQVGKRFPCRRCKSRVRVPRDLFERALEPNVEVDEFTLSSSDMAPTDDASLDAPTQRVAAAAATAVASVKKVQKKSIADLAAEATKAQQRRLPRKTKLGVRELVTIAVCLAGLGGIGYGFVLWRDKLAQAKLDEQQAERDRLFQPFQTDLERLMARADEALANPNSSVDPEALFEELEKVRSEGQSLLHEQNREKAAEMVEKVGLREKQRQLLTTQGTRLVEQGGYKIDEGIQALKKAAEHFPDSEDTALLLGEILVRARRGREAAEVLGKLHSEEAKALLGLAYERGAQGSQAADAYNKLADPLGPVLAARAWISADDADRAISSLEQINGLKGVDEAVAKVVEGVAKARKGDKQGAVRAFTEAIRAGQDDPFPRLFRAQFLLRNGGRVSDALKDVEQSNQIARTALGYLVYGDVLAAELKLNEARQKYADAINLPVHQEQPRLVAGRVDPYHFAFDGDPRAEASCRLGALALEADDFQMASENYSKAEELDPFYALCHVGLANVLLRQGGDAQKQLIEPRLNRAEDLCRRGDGVEDGELVTSPASARTLLARANLQVLNGRPQEAVTTLDAAKKCDPDVEPQVEALKSQIYTHHLTQEKRALSSSRRAARAEVQTDLISGRLYNQVLKLFEQKPTDPAVARRAIDGLELVLALNPYHAHALVLRSRARVVLKQYPQALADLDRAEAANPFLRDVFVTRGFLLVRDLPEEKRSRETNERAGRDFDVALNLEASERDKHAETQYGRGLVHYLLNEHVAAEANLTACLELDNTYAPAYKLRGVIRQRRNDPGAEEDLKRYQQLTSSKN